MYIPTYPMVPTNSDGWEIQIWTKGSGWINAIPNNGDPVTFENESEARELMDFIVLHEVIDQSPINEFRVYPALIPTPKKPNIQSA